MIEAYKIATGKYETGIAAVLQFDNRTGPATSDHKLKKGRCNTRLRQNFFTERIINACSSLPSTIVEAPSVLAFERRLDNYWKHQEVKFNYEAVLSLAPHANQQAHQQKQDLDIKASRPAPSIHLSKPMYKIN